MTFQASAFMLKLGCKAACMTVGVSPVAVDGMSAALGINFLAGQQVNSTALLCTSGCSLLECDRTGDHVWPQVRGRKYVCRADGLLWWC